MAHLNDNPVWKQTEKLVALIEQSLDDSEATVNWNETILDKDSGEPRQIDILVKNKLGTTEILVAIECRNRNRPAGSQWIEELVGKQKSVGASKMIAVSTSGFTSPAQKKADALGIETRVLGSISIDDVKQWASFKAFTFIHNSFKIIDATLYIDGFTTNDSLAKILTPDQYQSLNSDFLHHHIARSENTSIPVIPENMVNHLLNHTTSPLIQNPQNGDSETHDIVFLPSESDGRWIVSTKRGDMTLSKIAMRIEFKYEVHIKTISDLNATSYRDASTNLAQHVGLSFDTSLGTHRVSSVIQPDGTQKMYFSLQKDDVKEE